MAPRKIFNGGKARDLRGRMRLEQLIADLGVNPQTGRPWHRDTLSNVELGHTQPGPDLASAWAEALGVPEQSLYYATWADLPNLHAARLAWMDRRTVRIEISDTDGRRLERFDTNDEAIAKRRVERAWAATPGAEVTLTPEPSDTP